MHSVLSMRALRRMLAVAALSALPPATYGCASGAADDGAMTDDGGGTEPDAASTDAKPDHTVSEGGTADVRTTDTSSGGDTGPANGDDASDGGGPEGNAGDGGTDDATVDAASDTGVDSGVDVQADAEPDAGREAGVDAGIDAPVDTGVDTGPPDTGAPDTGAPDTGAPDTGVDAPVLPACATSYSMGNCTSYVAATVVSDNGHNWTCAKQDCANCGTTSMCAPGASGCPWGVVWTDEGACQ
jgi:hypothetical protein